MLARRRVVCLHESIEEPVLGILRDAGARILDRNPHEFPLQGPEDGNRSPCRGELQCVSYQIDQDLFDLVPVEAYYRHVGVATGLHRHASSFSGRFEGIHHVLDELGKAVLAVCQGHLALFELGQVQQVVDQLEQTEGIRVYAGEVCLLLLLKRPHLPLQHRLHRAQGQGKGRAEFVAHVVEKVHLHLVQGLELLVGILELCLACLEFLGAFTDQLLQVLLVECQFLVGGFQRLVGFLKFHILVRDTGNRALQGVLLLSVDPFVLPKGFPEVNQTAREQTGKWEEAVDCPEPQIVCRGEGFRVDEAERCPQGQSRHWIHIGPLFLPGELVRACLGAIDVAACLPAFRQGKPPDRRDGHEVAFPVETEALVRLVVAFLGSVFQDHSVR